MDLKATVRSFALLPDNVCEKGIVAAGIQIQQVQDAMEAAATTVPHSCKLTENAKLQKKPQELRDALKACFAVCQDRR